MANRNEIKPKTPTLKKLKKIRVSKPSKDGENQQILFDLYGFAPFSFSRDAQPIPGAPGEFNVAGMRLKLLPPPRNCKKAVEITINALISVHRARGMWRYSRPGRIEPLKLDSWECASCTATFCNKDHGAVQATYSLPGNLVLSLPPPRMWKTCGLDWLGVDHACCERNRNNPTPWLGRSCGCQDEQ